MEAQLRGARGGMGRRRMIGAGVGVAVMLVALFADYLTGAPRALGRAQIALALIGLAIAIIAVAGRRTPELYRGAALLLLNTIVILAAAELAAGLILQRWTPNRSAPPQLSQARYFATVPWGARFWREFSESGPQRYEPYALWRHRKFQGSLLQVAADGERRTPGAKCTPGALTVFVLGGSVAWGLGLPDSLTIPAFMQSELAQRRATDVCVRNLAELAYVSTQEIITLVRELQKGHVPQIVVFFDGANDPYATYRFGQPGAHFDQEDIAAKVEGRQQVSGARLWLRSSKLYQLVAAVAKPKAPTQQRRDAVRRDSTGVAEEVIQVYRRNEEVVWGLARQYGFTPYFFWQPMIYSSHKTLTADEKRVLSLRDEAYRDVFLSTYGLAKGMRADSNFRYLGDLFDAVSEPIFVDAVHLTQEGNAITARRIVAVLDSAAASRRRSAPR